MRLRRIAIGLAAFVVVFGVLAVVLRWWVKRRMGPPPLPIVVVLPEVPADNGYDVFVSAVATYVDTGVDLSTEPGVPITAEQRDALRQNEEVLAELRRGLEKECVVPLGSVPVSAPPAQGGIARWQAFRELTRLLVVESRLASDDGRYAAAVPPLLDGLRFGAKLEAGADIGGWHVARAIQSIPLRELRRLGECQHLGEAELAWALQILAEVEANTPPIAEILEAECRTMAASVGSQASGRSARVVGLDAETVAAAVRVERDEAVRLSQKSYAEVRAAIESAPRRWTLSPSRAVAQMMGPGFRKTVAVDFRRHSERRGAQVLLAIELYRLKHGKLPESLQQLEGLEIPGVELSIIDPLTEKPYIYRVQNGDYFLYSIGMDLKDDGGLKQSYDADKPGDLLFHTPEK